MTVRFTAAQLMHTVYVDGMRSHAGSQLCLRLDMPAAPSACMEMCKAAQRLLVADTLSRPGASMFTACYSWPHKILKRTEQKPSAAPQFA